MQVNSAPSALPKPKDRKAERALPGALIIDSGRLEEVAPIVGADDLALRHHVPILDPALEGYIKREAIHLKETLGSELLPAASHLRCSPRHLMQMLNNRPSHM